MSQKNKIALLENNLKVLLANSSILDNLIDYIEELYQDADERYTKLARYSVFEPNGNKDAIKQYGVLLAYEKLRTHFLSLRIQ